MAHSSIVEPSCPLENNKPIIVGKKVVKVRMSIFFDGTSNNRYNVAARKGFVRGLFMSRNTNKMTGINYLKDSEGFVEESEMEETWASKYFDVADLSEDKRESYDENDYTNVEKLERYLKLEPGNFDYHFKQYIEGIGTMNFLGDFTWGQGLGVGTTGIKGKVEQCIDSVVNVIKNNIKWEEESLENLSLDVFGFSRGAAAARMFVHEAKIEDIIKKKLRVRLKRGESSYSWTTEVLFAGLFDTVASFLIGNNPIGIYNLHRHNISLLNLDSVKEAKKIIHITAKDEYRRYFPLVHVTQGNYEEIALPGAHSDIGGGYKPIVDEVDNKDKEKGRIILDLSGERVKLHIGNGLIRAQLHDPLHPADSILNEKFTDDLTKAATEDFKKKVETKFEDDKKWLLDEGWIIESEVKEKLEVDSDNMVLRLRRRGIKNDYSKIPLNIMKNHAFSVDLKFYDTQFEAIEAIRPAENATKEEKENIENLISLQKSIKDFGEGAKSVDKELVNRVKRHFFHFSAYYGKTAGAYDPLFEGNIFSTNRERDEYPEKQKRKSNTVSEAIYKKESSA